ncbi:FKBP-type peptidyl-prolyl cis-trans isomerase [Saccharomonospora iraqiensis]|uniref:hypothetical protein n=1 Tax=Saccharomonospora iraqiensis TaxID=52698 RepID=UPI00022E122B|nr:hypothetical protein [Saccharomonospora iraqiensis]
MRNAGKIMTAAVCAAALAACSPPSEQPSDVPPDTGASPGAGAPEQPTGSPGEQEPQEECTAEDITVTEEGEAGGEGPQVTIPEGCAVPTELVTRELDEGVGPGAEPGGLVEFDYTMVSWSGGEVLRSTFGEPATETVEFGQEQQEFDAWEEALVDIKERGRRLMVVPAEEISEADSGPAQADEAVVIVAEVVAVDTPQ